MNETEIFTYVFIYNLKYPNPREYEMNYLILNSTNN